MQDWATHTDEDQVCQTLCVLLRECERDRDPGHLRRVLSDFFLALPDPWKTKASSILAAQTLDFGGKHADRRASQQASCSTFRCSERGTSNDLPFVF